jgi:predicted transcriptional regulator
LCVKIFISKKKAQIRDTSTIKNRIGLSQEEMAMLLGITESQWSMYKSGTGKYKDCLKDNLT